MAGRVAGLGAEGRAEGVHVAERHGEDLGVELARHGQGHRLAEEILGEVHLAFVGQGLRVGVQRGHAEHLARALAVAAGDQRGVHVQVAHVVEEAVDGLRCHRAHPERALEQVRAGTQVLNCAQVLQRVALLLQRIVRRALADDGHAVGLQLKGLLHVRREHQRARHLDGRTHADGTGRLGIVGQLGLLQNDLKVAEVGAVVQLDEGEGLGLAHGAHPAVDLYLRNILLRHAGVELTYQIVFHVTSLISRYHAPYYSPLPGQSKAEE